MKLEDFLELNAAQQIAALKHMSPERKDELKDALRAMTIGNISKNKRAIYEEQNCALRRTNNNLASAQQHLEKAKERLEKILQEKADD